MRPVGLPWASWVWNTRRGRRAAGGGGKPIWDSPAPLPPRGPGSPTPSPLRPGSASSFSTRGGAFFRRPSPSGMSSQKWGLGQETCRKGTGLHALCNSFGCHRHHHMVPTPTNTALLCRAVILNQGPGAGWGSEPPLSLSPALTTLMAPRHRVPGYLQNIAPSPPARVKWCICTVQTFLVLGHRAAAPSILRNQL